jgi:hypothetical protein
MMGWSALTRPLAGSTSRTPRPSRTWLTGSRLDTTNTGRLPKRASTNCLRRSSVHRLSPARRRRASCSAAFRTRASVRARLVTSVARGPNRLASASGGGATGCPAFSWLVHSAMRAIGRVTDHRTAAQVMPVTSNISTPMRTPVRRQRFQSAASRYCASRRTATAPIDCSSCWSGSTWAHMRRAATGWNLETCSFFCIASVMSGEIGPMKGRTSEVAPRTLPKLS